MDSSQKVQNGVTYSFKVTEAGGSVVKDVHDQPAQDGTGVQTLTFTRPGPASVIVSLDAVNGNPTGEFVESSTLGLLVQGSYARTLGITLLRSTAVFAIVARQQVCCRRLAMYMFLNSTGYSKYNTINY
jgi:hypothetical protein